MSGQAVAQTEYAIDEALVRNLLDSRFPEMRPAQVAFFGEGWDFNLYQVNKDKLFRFPKRADCLPRLTREIAVLAALGPSLPVPTPRFRWIADGKPEFPSVFAGYPLIQGQVACHVEPSAVDQDRVLDQVSAFLKALHGSPLAIAKKASLENGESKFQDCVLDAEFLKKLEQTLPLLPDSLAGAVKSYVENWEDAPLPESRPCIIHNDLTSVHVVVNGDAGELAGIIDWGDLCLGHPIGDLSGWYAWLGKDFAWRLLQALQVPAPQAWMVWMRNTAFRIGIQERYYAERTGNENDRVHGLRTLREVTAD